MLSAAAVQHEACWDGTCHNRCLKEHPSQRCSLAELDCAGAFDTFLNVQITLVLALQMALCLACSLVSLWWRNTAGYARYYLALNVYNEGMRASHSSAGNFSAVQLHGRDCCFLSSLSARYFSNHHFLRQVTQMRVVQARIACSPPRCLCARR